MAPAKAQLLRFCNSCILLRCANCALCSFATIATCRRGCGNARSSARASRSSTRPCACSPSAATTRRRSPTSPPPPTSRRARSSPTSRRRRRSSSTTSTATSTAWRRALRDRLPGETAFDALRRWIDAMFDHWMAEEDEALLRKRLCREDEGLANFQGGMLARIHELLLEAIAERPRRAAGRAASAARGRRGDGGADLARGQLRREDREAPPVGQGRGAGRARRRHAASCAAASTRCRTGESRRRAVGPTWRNHSRDQQCRPRTIAHPQSTDELVQLVRDAERYGLDGARDWRRTRMVGRGAHRRHAR